MVYVSAPDVDRAVAEVTRALRPHTSADWSARAGSLEWTCWTTAAHVAHDLLAYAAQVAARQERAYLPFDLTIASCSWSRTRPWRCAWPTWPTCSRWAG